MAKQSGILTESDLIKIGNLIDTRLELKLDQKLDQKMADYPTKQQAMADKTEILKAISDFKNEDQAHKQLHSDLGEDIPKIQKQIQHLFKTFEIIDPTEATVSI